MHDEFLIRKTNSLNTSSSEKQNKMKFKKFNDEIITIDADNFFKLIYF